MNGVASYDMAGHSLHVRVATKNPRNQKKQIHKSKL